MYTRLEVALSFPRPTGTRGICFLSLGSQADPPGGIQHHGKASVGSCATTKVNTCVTSQENTIFLLMALKIGQRGSKGFVIQHIPEN